MHNVVALYRTAKVPNRLYDEVNVDGVRFVDGERQVQDAA